LSSKEAYDITRQYIKTHIDTQYAKITSDYDFCFEVKKVVPIIEPQTLTYQNIFAKSKKERDKIRYVTNRFKETTIFQMTHEQERYKGYTPIRCFQAGSEYELKELIDGFLEDLIAVINKPLEQCPHCNGTGYTEGNS
jgi:excinuclease UvrABC ATPase subunit